MASGEGVARGGGLGMYDYTSGVRLIPKEKKVTTHTGKLIYVYLCTVTARSGGTNRIM